MGLSYQADFFFDLTYPDESRCDNCANLNQLPNVPAKTVEHKSRTFLNNRNGIKCQAIAALAFFDQGLFIHRFLLLLILSFTRSGFVLAGVLYLNEHHQRSRNYQRKTKCRFFGQALFKHDCGKCNGHKNTKLIDRNDNACKPVLQGLVIAQP